MTRNQRDAAPKGGNGKVRTGGAGDAPITASQVATFLRDNPDFFDTHTDLLDGLSPPGGNHGTGVVDLQQFMVARLRNELADARSMSAALVETGRGNLAAQARTHEAVLALLGAGSFEHFIETLTTDLAVILDLDVVTIGVEQSDDDLVRPPVEGVVRLEPQMVDALVGPGQSITLRAEVAGDPAIFGPGAGLVQSEALLRLKIGQNTPAALLALGSRRPEQFHPGQGSELLNFLARVVEGCIRGWLNLPE